MTHSHLTQWIEDADAREVCRAASWSRAPATTESHLGETILNMPGAIVSYALACARLIAPASDQSNRTDRPSPPTGSVGGSPTPTSGVTSQLNQLTINLSISFQEFW
jgi:hypothetical protein